VGYSKFLRDISGRKLAKDALVLSNSILEQRVAERTEDLARARDRAESADRLKSAFLATMSHELRTPLNSIIGFTGIILQQLAGPTTAEQLKQLGMVRSSALHLLALINDVLDISKIEAGQFHLYSESFDLRSSVEKTIAALLPSAERKGLSMRVEQLSSLDPLVSDRRRVEQVLINLMNNGIKFTDRGEVCVSIEAVPECKLPGNENPTACVRVRIADTGLGIKPEELPYLFQPFRQLDYGLARRHEGTGLGLMICSRLMDMLGGTIHVESTIGVGSTFTITLPVNRGADL
jgi:signal transduction histidine kinase